MLYSFDRVEDNIAVLIGDDNTILNVNLSVLYDGATVGDIFESYDKLSFEFLKEETEKRKNEAVSLHKKLIKK